MVAIHEDTGGELGLRMVLETCFGDEGAELASGWGGDRYRISRLADGRLALQWAIAWDDATRAERFEKSVPRLSTCWSDALARDEARNVSNRLAPGLKIARSGAKVAIVRGLGDQPDVDALFASIGTAPAPAPPVTPRELAPKLAITEPEAKLVGRRFDVTPFGFVFDVPATLSAARFDSTGLLVHDTGDFLELSLEVIPTTAVDKSVAAYVQRIEAQWGSVKLMDGGKGTVETSMGTAIERRWYVGGALARVLVVPLCGGMRSVIVRAVFLADDARAAEYQALLASFKRTNEDPPPACR